MFTAAASRCADHRRRRVVHPDGRRRRLAHLQPHRERRAVPPGRSAATACSASSRACACGSCRAPRSSASSQIIDTDELMPAFEQRIADGFLYGDCQFSTDTSSDAYPAQGRVLVLPPGAADAPIPAEQKELSEARLARALSSVARRHGRGLRRLHVLLPLDVGAALLVRHAPAQRLHRRLPRRARPPARQRRTRHGDDHRDLRAASRAAANSSPPCARTSAGTASSSSTARSASSSATTRASSPGRASRGPASS